jgi:hypothetical protein
MISETQQNYQYSNWQSMLCDIQWLVSDESAEYIQWTNEQLFAQVERIVILKNLREKISPSRSSLVLSQCLLRQKAKTKFCNAEHLFFHELALQQATGSAIAVFKARRFQSEQPMIDICCGIGGDLLALAARAKLHQNKDVFGVDNDAATCVMARANVRNSKLFADIQCCDAAALKIPSQSQLHIDPSRRNQLGRTTKIEFFQPKWDVIENLVDRAVGSCIKIAPASVVPDDFVKECERQWIGHQRECKQQLCWTGQLAKNPGKKSVVVIDDQGNAAELVQEIAEKPSVTDQLRRYLFVPQAAVDAADLIDELACQLQLPIMRSSPKVLTSENKIQSRLGSGFELIRESGSRKKRLNDDLQAIDCGELELKCRPPMEQYFASLRKHLRFNGTKKITLFPIRVNNENRILLCRRC